MAHRKHLSQEGHAAPEHIKKAAHEQNKKFNNNKPAEQKESRDNKNKSNYNSSSVKDEHGEY